MFQMRHVQLFSLSTSSCPCARHRGNSSSDFLGSKGMNLCMCVYTSAHLNVCVFTLAILLAYQGSQLLTLSIVTVQCEPQILPDLAYSF